MLHTDGFATHPQKNPDVNYSMVLIVVISLQATQSEVRGEQRQKSSRLTKEKQLAADTRVNRPLIHFQPVRSYQWLG